MAQAICLVYRNSAAVAVAQLFLGGDETGVVCERSRLSTVIQLHHQIARLLGERLAFFAGVTYE
jgi:hypothetical protein